MTGKTFHLGFRVAYDGSSFKGFQLQERGPTVQKEIERILKILFRRDMRIIFTSRTDAGVHAWDQWVIVRNGYSDFEKLTAKEKARFVIAFNALSKNRVVLWQILKLAPSFHPKNSVRWKEYSYRIFQGLSFDPLEKDRSFWIRDSLDLKAMKAALRELEGEHDFTAFSKTASRRGALSNRRKVVSARLRVEKHSSLPALHLSVEFRADGFLHHMVRNLVGTLLQIGRGQRSSLLPALQSKDRRAAGPNLPGFPLILKKTSVYPRFIADRLPKRSVK